MWFVCVFSGQFCGFLSCVPTTECAHYLPPTLPTPFRVLPPRVPTYPVVPLLCLEKLCLKTLELHISRFV